MSRYNAVDIFVKEVERAAVNYSGSNAPDANTVMTIVRNMLNQAQTSLSVESVAAYGAIGDGTSHPLSEIYDTLEEAQDVYPHATDLSDEMDWCAIVKAINAGSFLVEFPEGSLVINKPIPLRSNLYMRGVGSGGYSGGTEILRNADVKMFTATGISITVQVSPFGLIQRVCAQDMIFDGGDRFGSGELGTGDRWLEPMWDLKACYEFYFTNCRWTNAAGEWMKAWEFWDSRFINCVWTFGGDLNGTIPALNLQSSTFSPGYETCNNLSFYGNRFESCPGVLTAMDGNNGVDFFFSHCKWESVFFQNDYLIRCNAATGVHFDTCWVYATGDTYKNFYWDVTESSKTPSIGAHTFTIATGVAFNNLPYQKQLFTNMYMLMYDRNNPTTYMTGRITDYNSGTGLLSITTDYAVGSAATEWRVAPCHPGLIHFRTNCRLVTGNLTGGYNGSSNVPVNDTYVHSIIRIDNSEIFDIKLNITAGADRLPQATFQAYRDTTTTANVGYGTKNFTIATGLTIPANTMLYIYGNSLSHHSNWMIGRVVSYDSGTGALEVYVDKFSFGGVPSDNVTGWTISRYQTKPVVQYNASGLIHNSQNKIRITGGAQKFGAPMGLNMQGGTYNEVNPQRIAGYGSALLNMRNYNTSDDWYWRVTNDPTTVPNPAGSGGDVTGNTGSLQLAVYDYLRGTEYTVLSVTGDRYLQINRPLIMNNKLWFIDYPSSPTYRQVSIVSALAAMPTSGSYSVGDIVLNSIPAVGKPVGWQCTATSPLTFRAFGFLGSGSQQHPGYKSGYYYAPQTAGATYLVSTKGRMFAQPFVVHHRVTVSHLSTYVGTGGSGSEVKAAIYDSTGTAGRPGARVAQGTTPVATDSVGQKDVALDSSVTLEPGIYWLVTMYDWTTTAPTMRTCGGILGMAALLGSATLLGAHGDVAQSGIQYAYADTTYASNFPASFGSATDIAGNSGALVGIKVA